MSLRAIKKRENQLVTLPTSVTSHNSNSRTSLFRKLNKAKAGQQQQQIVGEGLPIASNSNTNHIAHSQILHQKHRLLGRLSRSNPEFGEPSEVLKRLESARLVRTKSEGDVNKLLSSQNPLKQGALLNAKSEVCLKTISTHSCQNPISLNNNSNQSLNPPSRPSRHGKNMLSGARSHRDLTQSAYASSGHMNNVEAASSSSSVARRRMSEGSYIRSQRANSMSASDMTSSTSVGAGGGGGSSLGHSVPPVDPNSVLRIPIIGYEVMEERARFTVYKLRVENPHTNDCWLVLRRYTDFVRLNSKLKQAFPHLVVELPRKKIFGDNFNSAFLDNRIQGLQMFVNTVMSKEELRKFQLVREFFCLDEPPSYSESMEECRAIFEAQEETIAHLKMQINNKNDLILQLQQKLREEHEAKEQLKQVLKDLNFTPTNGNA